MHKPAGSSELGTKWLFDRADVVGGNDSVIPPTSAPHFTGDRKAVEELMSCASSCTAPDAVPETAATATLRPRCIAQEPNVCGV